MAVADALNKYFRRVRRWFPFGFSRYFHTPTSDKRQHIKEIMAFDNEVVDGLLATVRQDAIILQNETEDFTYRNLVKEFGYPHQLMKELIMENLPEAEFVRLKRKKRLAINICVVAILLSLSIPLVSIINTRMTASITEENTLIIKSSNFIPSVESVREYIASLSD